MKKEKITTDEMELAIANLYNVRRHMIVPNVSWGLGMHECDMLIVRPTGYAIEIEIKRTLSDTKADAVKKHGHKDRKNRIKELIFAFPEDIHERCIPHIPIEAGVIVCKRMTTGNVRAYHYRPAKARKGAVPLTEDEQAQVTRLGALRIWGLKKKLVKAKRDMKKLTAMNEKRKK